MAKKDKQLLTIPNKLPLLEGLCWNIAFPYQLTPVEMLGIYEERWQFKDLLAKPSTEEIKFIQNIIALYQGLPLLRVNYNMDKKKFYQLVTLILSYLDKEILQQRQTYLGGGALINLEYGRFRLSQDLDFLCSPQGYLELKQLVVTNGTQILFKSPCPFEIGRNPRIDRYAIRFPIKTFLDGEEVNFKIEFVAEGWLKLEQPDYDNQLGVPCLNLSDRIAAKLLANADRWADRSKYSRDLIDLAMICQSLGSFPVEPLLKAESIYRVKNALMESIQQFQNLTEYRANCYKQLQIELPALVINGLDLLAAYFDLEPTKREFIETDFSYLE